MDTAAHPLPTRDFASDNWAGVHPEVLTAIAAANHGHAAAYGGDEQTAAFAEVARRHFGQQALAFPVFNGTGANVLALQAALPRWGAVICASTAHIVSDETGAPEKTGGIKLLPVPTPDGKLTPELIDREAWGFGNPHRAQPLVVSISQTTELGTCYTPAEIRAISDHAHRLGLTVHLDGSRLSNAAAHLGTSLAAFTSDAGVDLVSLGGTKNGALGAEAVIVLDQERAHGLEFLRKISLQLPSKMRFVSAQLNALYADDLWLRSATQANQMAARLAAGLRTERVAALGVQVVQPVESNGVFATMPTAVADRARAHAAFGSWPGDPALFRLMCAWDTTAHDVDAFLEAFTAA